MMNERVKELFEQAYDGKFPTTIISIHPTELEKFAELIIDEVLQVIAVSDSNCYNEWDFAERDIYVEIQKHFGVE